MSAASAPRARDIVARLDPSREALNALLGPAAASRPDWESAARAEGADAETRLWRARALNALGRPADALAELAQAPGAEAAVVAAEARLILGESDGARAALDRALAAEPRLPAARLLSAVARLTAGELDAAEADLELASAAGPLLAAARAVRALALAQRGDERGGEALLSRALAERPAGWLFALRGTLRRGLGDLAGARADLDEAVKTEESAWALAQRADVLNRSGFYRDALADLARAAALAPGSASPHAQAANVYFDQAFYPEAVEAMDRALALAPSDPGLLARRARFDTVLGRLDAAERGYARASSLSPDDSGLRFERLGVLAMLDRGAEVLRAVAAGAVREPFAGYLRGYVAFRAGRRARARALFLGALRRADGAFAERLRLYAEVAAVLGDRPRRPRARARGAPRFYLCGIGIRHPYQATVEILRALDQCAVIYNNLGDPQIADFLGLFRADIRAVDRRPGEPALGRVRRILGGIRASGPPTGFVTRIHPFIYRRIANDLAQVCEDRGIRYRAYGAVSLTEAAWGLGDERAPVARPGAPFGGRAFDLVWLVAHADQLSPRHATVVYCIASAEHRLALCALLSARYPAAHPAYVLAGSGDKEGEVRPLTIAGLAEALPRFDMGAVLYVPALGGES
jgi:tetratricopeptide (TPR) repeat protein